MTNEIFSSEQRDEILTYLVEELELAEQEKARKKDKWDKWRRQREGFPEHKQKDYPFVKSANVAVPLSVSNHNTLYGAAMNMFGDIIRSGTSGPYERRTPRTLPSRMS